MLVALLLAFCGFSKAQWVQTSGVAGSDVMSLGVVGSTVFAATMYSGTFYSNNYGNTWIPTAYGVNVAMGVSSFAVDGNVIYGCGSNMLFKSSDYGQNWDTIQIPSASGGAITISAGTMYIGGGSSLGIFSCALGDTNWVLSGLQGQNINCLATGIGGAWATTDQGVYRLEGGTWTCKLAKGAHCMAFWGNFIYAGSGNGVWVSETNGVSWVLIQSGEAVDPSSLLVAENTIYAACWNGIYSSPLGGNINWTKNVNGLDFWRVHSLAYAGNQIFAGVCGGVYVSGNGGGSWSRRNTGLIGTNCFLRTNGGRMIARGNPIGFWYTTDKGDHWSDISNGLERYDHIRLEIHDLAFSGTNYYTGTESGLYSSYDQGARWISTSTGLTNSYIYAVTTAGPWIFANGGDNSSGVSRASLGDMQFYDFSDGMPSADVQLLKTIADTDIWAGTCDQGLLRRGMSGAKPWQAMNNGITNTCVMALAGDANCMFAGTYDGFYRSYTHGESWEKIENPWVGAVGGISVKGDTVIIMSNNGIWYSKTQGSSFSNICSDYFFGGPSIFIGPQDVFVGTSDVGVWRRAWSDIHSFHLTLDSVVLKALTGSRDSLYIECDTNWYIQGYMPDFLSANRLSGKGNGYVVFTALQPNTNDYELVNAFELHSSDGQSVGFSVRQLGKSSGLAEPGRDRIAVWPNPTSGLVNISSQSPVRSVTVYSADGVVVKEQAFSGAATRVSVELPGTGIWFIRIVSLDGIETKKVTGSR